MQREKCVLVFLVSFSVLTLLFLPLSAFLPTKEDTALYDSVIRLHVLANSDSDTDQQIKLTVRDAVLSTAAEAVRNADTVEAAKTAVLSAIPSLESAAVCALREQGMDYTAKVTLTYEDYPTRSYDNVRLPAGRYLSLRVLLGEANGHNWWCVLFPQLCVPSADSLVTDEKALEVGLTSEQLRLITDDSPEIVVRFRLLEWFQKLWNVNE